MKKLLIVFFGFIVFSSCKKEYNCNCVTTLVYVNSGNTDSYYSSTKPISSKLTEKQAKAVCAREESSVNETYVDLASNNGNWNPPNFSASTSCKIQE